MASSGAHIAATQIVFHRGNRIPCSVKPPVIVAFRVARTGLSDKIPRLQRPETHGGTALAHPRTRSFARARRPLGGAEPHRSRRRIDLERASGTLRRLARFRSTHSE